MAKDLIEGLKMDIHMEATIGMAELSARLCRVQRVLPKAFEHMPHERGRVPMNELLVFFKDGRSGQGESYFENYRTCPVLIAPRHNKHYLIAENSNFPAMPGL